ncbi:molybdenum cofactor guanylyltransferase MobA [Govanella unica]|uniref:Molybdenum cofactor guanylyltransferase n=1 Tax=Govanella unica TaxID=2975056 RepID=A0A9X3Z662_9PROT|nr:molybdenum cofactor guanylyltransferase MobA [Govania unica]MDA5192855.1 molybdenum cofactor guanylyltransferase [Govania unica]
MKVLAIIFAGGQGRRMGGVDKALVTLGGYPLIRHVEDRLRPQVTRMIINANGDPSRFSGLVVADDPTSALDGPFRALETALRMFAPDEDATHLLHVPVDVPFLPDDLVARLAAEDAVAAFPVGKGQLHPVICLWSRKGAARAALRLKDYDGERFADFIQGTGGKAVGFDDQPDAFLNINSPEDLARATRLIPSLRGKASPSASPGSPRR